MARTFAELSPAERLAFWQFCQEQGSEPVQADKPKRAALDEPGLFGGQTDSDLIRDILTTHGNIKPKEVLALVKKKFGKDVSLGNINQTKVKMKKDGKLPDKKKG